MRFLCHSDGYLFYCYYIIRHLNNKRVIILCCFGKKRIISTVVVTVIHVGSVILLGGRYGWTGATETMK